jgi:hypothetical protein
MKSILRAACGLVLAVIASVATAQGGTRAFLDRDQIVLGETVTLNIETDRLGVGEPDLSGLGADVRVLGSSSSTQISLVNGQQSSRTLWGVSLEPLQVGVIGIPAIEIRGETTAPLQLTVLPATRATQNAGGDLLLEIEASPENPYVQQQVIYTVRLLYAVTLLDGQLDEPRAQGADIRRLGGDATFTREAGGRRYQVIERRYAITPQASGRLPIEAPRFRGRALAGPRGNRMFDPGSPVAADGESIELDVRARPASAVEPWLPALDLDYRLQTGASGQLKTGEPITLSLRISARGLSAEQLPELRLPTIEGAEVYPDQEASQTREGPRGVEGERTRSFAVVPNRPGELVIPELGIDWWNTAQDRAERALIAEQRFSVEGTARTDAATGPVPAVDPSDSERVVPNAAVDGYWRWVGLVFLVLWLLTLALLLRERRRPRTVPVLSPAAQPMPMPRVGPQLAQALRQGELELIAEALRTLAGARGLTPSLDALQQALADPAQARAVSALQRALYGGGAGAASLEALRKAFATPPRFQSERSDSIDPLPPLYPSRM